MHYQRLTDTIFREAKNVDVRDWQQLILSAPAVSEPFCKSAPTRTRRTHVHGPPVLHTRGDERAAARLHGVLLIRQPALDQLAVHVDGQDAGLHRNAQFVPLPVEERLQVPAPEGVMEAVLQQASSRELHHLLTAIHDDGHL